MDRRAGISLAAFVASSLLLTTGCGGHDSKAGKPSASAGKGSVAARPAASGEKAAPALTRKQLESAVIKSSDVPGFEVAVPKSASGLIGGEHMVADKAACQPVADALSETGAVKPVAAVERSAVAKNLSGVMVRVRLASYSGGDADKVMADLSNAVTACTGFTGSSGNDSEHVGVADYDGYLTAQGPVDFRLTTKVGKQTLPIYLDVGREGTTVEYFVTFNVTGDDPLVGPTEVETPQTVKLITAGR